MSVERFAMRLEYSLLGAFVAMSLWPAGALAQSHDDHPQPAQQAQTAAQKKQASALVRVVREATERFRMWRRPRGRGIP